MDDENINKICLGIEEVELDGEEKEWIKLSWINSDDDENSQSPGTQGDSDNGIAQIKDCDNKVSFTSAESEDISDGISVITDSDTDVVNTNLFQICRFKSSQRKLEGQLNRQKDVWNIFIACVFGIIIGLALSYLFTIPKTRPVSLSDEVDAESLRTASHNIVNTCKELADVKTMLNEIKAHIPVDKKITKQNYEFLAQFFEITDFSNNTRNKPIITKEFFNSTPRSLDQLQESLHVLSSLASIYSNNSSLKNEINKTLDIINNTKIFYDTLILLTNNTQDEFNPVILNFLQHNDKMHITSKLFLSNLIEKVSKVTSKIYNKYAKEKHRLNKKLCRLKNILPDDKFVKRLTENNQLFKDYDKSCFSNYTSKNLNNRTIIKENTESIIKENTESIIKGNTKITEQIKTNTISHPYDKKYDKKNIHIIHDDNKENSLKDKNNKKQNIDKHIKKFLQDTGHKIHNTSQLFISEVSLVENISKLRRQLNKKLHHLKNILPNSEFLKELFEDDKNDNKESVKCCGGKDDYIQSNIISKNGIPKNSFDNILMQLKNTCPLSTNYCPNFNINMSTFDTVPNYKTKNYKHKKQEKNKKIVDHRNSAKILPTEGQNRSKKKNYFKSNGSTKKIVNDKANYEEKNISSQNKKKNHISDHTVYHDKSKHSSFDSRTMKQDNQYFTNTDRRSDSKRFNEYKKQRHLDDSDWYFRRAHSRRNARRHAEYIYNV